MKQSPIVFTTAISDKIRFAYKRYIDAPKDTQERRVAFNKFADACEKESRDKFLIIQELSSK